MRNVLLIGAMILLYTLQSLLCKKYSDHYPVDPNMASPVFTLVSGAVVVAVSFAVAGFSFVAAPVTLLLAVCNAAVLVGYNTCIIKASQTGAYSVLMVFSIAGGIFIPVISGVIFFEDRLSPFKLAALALILLAVYMVSHRKGEALATDKLFLPACALLGICNGTYGALLDAQQRLTGSGEKEEMVAVTYGLAIVISFAFLLIRQRRSAVAALRQTRRSAFYLLTCSVVVALAINLMVYIIPLVDLAVLYTFDNAGTFLFSVLASCVFFREKLSRLNAAGCVLMCGALVAVSLL
ncbi:MAG: hypothetical protein IJW51_06060 [Clostridia bacterium]|nr:hypothetical protein [Clostridia bacterium]